jgi:hypothetical protein
VKAKVRITDFALATAFGLANPETFKDSKRSSCGQEVVLNSIGMLTRVLGGSLKVGFVKQKSLMLGFTLVNCTEDACF